MFKLIFYVPEDSCEKVKSAVFKTGAGTLGQYSHCSWQTLGIGQFKPLEGANPAVGEVNTLEKVPELRVEVLCAKSQIKPAISALKEAHPYEEVAFEVVSILNHDFE